MRGPKPIEYIPLYGTIGEFLDDHASEATIDLYISLHNLSARRAVLLFSRRNPRLLNCKYPRHGRHIQA